MDKIYHNYKHWEDFIMGMYESTAYMDDAPLIKECINLLSCPEWLNESMLFVSHNWVKSAEQNLTNIHRNRQAWLGQAACCWSHGAPEYITKKAWGLLTPDQQKNANGVADEVINDWELKHRSGYFHV